MTAVDSFVEVQNRLRWEAEERFTGRCVDGDAALALVIDRGRWEVVSTVAFRKPSGCLAWARLVPTGPNGLLRTEDVRVSLSTVISAVERPEKRHKDK